MECGGRADLSAATTLWIKCRVSVPGAVATGSIAPCDSPDPVATAPGTDTNTRLYSGLVSSSTYRPACIPVRKFGDCSRSFCDSESGDESPHSKYSRRALSLNRICDRLRAASRQISQNMRRCNLSRDRTPTLDRGVAMFARPPANYRLLGDSVLDALERNPKGCEESSRWSERSEDHR